LQLVELALTAEERPAERVAARARMRSGVATLVGCVLRDDVERGVVSEDVPLEVVEGAAGIDAELVDERSARALIDGEGVRLTTAAIERQHLQRTDALAQRMLLRERREFSDEIRMTSETQVGLDAILERHQAKLLEPRDRSVCERVVGEVGKRGTAPQIKRLAQRRGGGRRVGICDLVA
jgi:hypothetical protein